MSKKVGLNNVDRTRITYMLGTSTSALEISKNMNRYKPGRSRGLFGAGLFRREIFIINLQRGKFV